jgi:hypothetical protein
MVPAATYTSTVKTLLAFERLRQLNLSQRYYRFGQWLCQFGRSTTAAVCYTAKVESSSYHHYPFWFTYTASTILMITSQLYFVTFLAW